MVFLNILQNFLFIPFALLKHVTMIDVTNAFHCKIFQCSSFFSVCYMSVSGSKKFSMRITAIISTVGKADNLI